MSFLGDLVNSIGTNKAPAFPKPAQKPPTASSAAHSNPVTTSKVLPSSSAPPVIGLKRKLDDRDTKILNPVEKALKPAPAPPEKVSRPNPAPGLSSKVNQKPSLQAQNGVKVSVPKLPPSSSSAGSSAPAKPPSKGSYAEMMAKAKEAQQTRVQNPIGTIKHQATAKEKVSKVVERRRLEQEKLKAEKDKKIEKPASTKQADRKRGSSPAKKSDQPKIPRAPRPPLHAPASSYKGTIGTAAKRPHQERRPRHSRHDEYLGTDEEDNSEMDDYDEDDGYGYSDASSDMEAGLDDIAMEEERALRAARQDDAKELAFENELKREKEERKRKLQAMARKVK